MWNSLGLPIRATSRPSITELWDAGNDGKLLLHVGDDGKVVHRAAAASVKLRHPILDLIEEAEQKWADTLDRQSSTLEEAVAEYQRRYKRLPPIGFDKWFNFAYGRGVVLIDEFDQINRDIAPFLAIPPAAAQYRLEKAAKHFDTYHISVTKGKLLADGGNDALVYLMEDFVGLLPDLAIHVSIHDMGPHIYGDDFRAEVNRVLAEGTYLSPENITTFESKGRNERFSVTKGCFPHAPAVEWEDWGRPSLEKNNTFSFIYDPSATQNFCNNPSLLRNHGVFLNPHAHDSFIFPLFVQCKLAQGGNIAYPTLYGFSDYSDQAVKPWSDHTINKLFWRGRTTGTLHMKPLDWKKNHRIRIHDMANNQTWGKDKISLLYEDPKTHELERRNYTRKDLNPKYLDIGLTGPLIQCKEEDGTCEEMRHYVKFVEPVYGPVKHKYVLDIDGNGWSGRYQALLASGAAVLKATIFPEWNSDWLIPYYHYIPVQHDYSDLYDVLAFFIGTPGEMTSGHDDLAAKIGHNSAHFVRNFWRWEDMQAYMFRLLLEYARAVSVDRDAMTYKPPAKP